MPTIIASTGDEARDYARRLLDAADQDATKVATDTSGPGVIGFTVSDELAAAAGFPTDADDEGPADDEVATGDEGQADSVGQADGDPAPDHGNDETTTAPADAPAVGLDAPARNASRTDWAEFLDAQDPPITYASDAKRDELVALWDAHTSGQQ